MSFYLIFDNTCIIAYFIHNKISFYRVNVSAHFVRLRNFLIKQIELQRLHDIFSLF